jgi:hypothetical protein
MIIKSTINNLLVNGFLLPFNEEVTVADSDAPLYLQYDGVIEVSPTPPVSNPNAAILAELHDLENKLANL